MREIPMKNNASLVSLIIKNSFIALAVHICLCLITICIIRGILSLVNAPMIVSSVIAVSCGAISLYLYFWAGKKYLHNTENVLMDYVTVFGFFALLVVSVIIMGGMSIFSLWSLFWVVFENSEAVYEPTGRLIHSMILTPAPSFLMWMGMIVKRKKAELEEEDERNNGKLYNNQ
ncbi:MAG: hypothetical protein FWE54_06880 [Methanimicrococcus sp.]|nr:hypothetical protein [Methanimicrococcus sp.]